MQAGVAIRPHRLVAKAVKTGVGIGAAIDMDAKGLRRREAEAVIAVRRLGVSTESLPVSRWAADGIARRVEPKGRGRDRIGSLAVFEVSNLVGEGHVVG